MKIIYKNTSQLIQYMNWDKKTKSATDVRCLVLDSCENLSTKTHCIMKVKILSNSTVQTSANLFLGCGANNDTDAISKFYGSTSSIDLTPGVITTKEVTFSVLATQISSDFDVKIGMSGSGTTVNNDLKTITWEVEYYFS